jgi:hypothetical protein
LNDVHEETAKISGFIALGVKALVDATYGVRVLVACASEDGTKRLKFGVLLTHFRSSIIGMKNKSFWLVSVLRELPFISCDVN